MTPESPIPNWHEITALLPPERPDHYHHSARRGDTRYGLEWLASENRLAPAAHDCAWSVLDAWSWFSSGQHWNGYAAETLLLAHSRLIGSVVADVLRAHRGRSLNGTNFDIGGADLFAEGLCGTLEALKTLKFEHEDFAPDKPDILDQLAMYVARAAKNQMLDYLDKMFPSRWRKAECLDESVVGRAEEWKQRLGQYEADRVFEVIKAACDKPWLWDCVLEWWTTDRTQEELATQFCVTRHEIQESMLRVVRHVEVELGLDDGVIKRRSRRQR